jgi:hypothetical protein
MMRALKEKLCGVKGSAVPRAEPSTPVSIRPSVVCESVGMLVED